MPPKRPGEGGRVADEESPKRARTGGAGGNDGAPLSIQAQLEAAKARAAALRASLNQRNALSQGSSTARPAQHGASSSSSAAVRGAADERQASSSIPAPTGSMDVASVQKQIAEAKRRAMELAGGRFGVSKAVSSPSTPSLSSQKEESKSSGIHPLLMTSSSPAGPSSASSTTRHFAPKYSILSSGARNTVSATLGTSAKTGLGNDQGQERVNPYLAGSAEDEEFAQSARGRARRRQMTFNAPGRHVRAAEEARREAQMEALKRRIEEQSKKAGLEELTAEERALRRPQPPGVEWWDQPFLPDQTSYDAVMSYDESLIRSDKGVVLIQGTNSPIDIYIQHPIPIPAPSDKIKIAPKGVMLTKREQKKMRRLRRRAEQEDKQDKIKMGLLPPDPPKVKLANLMRVLTSEAVADPTKVEARVRREVAARQDKHEQTNLERMLTPEQRRAKVDEEKEKDLAKGVYTLVFKVRHLVSPSHKFKVRKNALQNGLTGMTLFGKDFALVLVEGGQKGIKAYRHLMLHRIDWHDPGRPKAAETGEGLLADIEVDSSTVASDSQAGTSDNDQGLLAQIDWSENFCRILFEGPVRERQFAYGFKARQCEADLDAKQALGPKMASYWDLAKRDDMAVEEDGL